MRRYDDGELLTLITLAKEITQSCFIRSLPQGKERRAQVGKGYTVRIGPAQLCSAVKFRKGHAHNFKPNLRTCLTLRQLVTENPVYNEY